MRLFIGVFPPKEVLDQIRDSIRSMDKIKRNFKFIQYDQIHMTVKFLGNNVSADSMQLIVDRLTEISDDLPSATIELENISFGFPGQKSPNVMFFSVKNNKSLNDFADIINDQVKFLGLEDTIKRKDRKKLTHHITIARVKHSVSNSLVRNTRDFLSNNVKKSEITFNIDNLCLVQSILGQNGPVYKKLNVFKIQ